MKALIAMAVLSAALLSAAGKQTFTGAITDNMCGADHKSMNMGPDDKCVIACVKGGAKYALWDGQKAYQLSDQIAPAKYAARKVKVTGVLDEKTGVIQVDSITAAK